MTIPLTVITSRKPITAWNAPAAEETFLPVTEYEDPKTEPVTEEIRPVMEISEISEQDPTVKETVPVIEKAVTEYEEDPETEPEIASAEQTEATEKNKHHGLIGKLNGLFGKRN